MKRRILWFTLTFLMVLSLTLVACAQQTTSPSTSNTTTSVAISTTPVSTSSPPASPANWWDKLGTPEYGGSISVQTGSMDFVNLDNQSMSMGSLAQTYETLFIASRTVDPANYQYRSSFIPTELYTGLLAERWEQVDPLTVNVYLRKGIHWTNKAPLNGREFTAADVQFNADRLLGTGSGYDTPNPFLAAMLPYTQKVTAIDTYTAQFKFKQASALALWDIFAPQLTIGPPEWEKVNGAVYTASSGGPPGGPPGGGGGPPGGGGGPPGGGSTGQAKGNDWHDAITTAPYNISDFVAGSTATFTKVDNYYLNDERYPNNKLPYLDSYKQVSIQDMSTALAALRTGKVDKVGGSGGPGGISATWQDVKSLKQTNPDIQVFWIPTEGPTLQMRTDLTPFTDIRVRQALSMAIDRKTIAATHYGGSVDPTPCGLMSPADKGWCTPYDQWPADLQKVYSYDPTDAKQLLADAGYPKGFNTDVTASTADDVELLQIIKAEFADIGVNMDIKTMDEATVRDYVSGGKYQGLTSVFANTGGMLSPWMAISVMKTGDRQNATHNNDAAFDAMYDKIVASTTQDEAKKLTIDADMYILQHCWQVFVFQGTRSVLYQSYVKGYNGEYVDSPVGYSRVWVDSKLKQSMGR